MNTFQRDNSRACERAEVRILRTTGEVEEIGSSWDELWSKTGSTIFQSPAWLLPFARHFVPEGGLRVFALFADDSLVGIAPLYLWREENVRKLLLMGSGIADYLDVIVSPGHEAKFVAKLSRWLDRFADEWDRLDAVQLPESSVLRTLGPTGFSAPCPRLDLARKTADDYAPARQLEKVRYYRRRAAKLGEVKFERAAEEICEVMMQKLFALHRSRWVERSEEGVLNGSRLQRFHLEAAKRMAATGNLRLYSLSLGDEVIAVFHGFASHGCMSYYLGGFNPNFDKLSPGTLLVAHAIEEALSEGLNTFDFLRGQESYKYAWGAQDARTWSVSIERSISA